MFLKWLNKEKFQKSNLQNKECRKIFTSEEREYLFLSILCRPDIVNPKEIKHNCYKSFEKFFNFYNRENRVIEIIKGNCFVFSYENLSGIDALWDIAIKAEDSNVKEEASHLLSIMHLNLDETNYDNENKQQIWKIFVER